MTLTSGRRRVGAIRLGIGAVLLLIVAGIWSLFLFGALSVERVGSGSMEPTFLEGDVLLVRRFHEGEIRRGELVVVQSPDDDYAPLLKRVVAIPGDHVDNTSGTFKVNGEPSPPPDSSMEQTGWAEEMIDLMLDDDEFYVLGDNRSRSYDSRDFGPVTRSLIIGRPVWRIGPAGRRGGI